MKIPQPKRVLSMRIEQLMAALREKRRVAPAQWSCGHTAGAMCMQCFRELAQEAHRLAVENARLRDELEEAKRECRTRDRENH